MGQVALWVLVAAFAAAVTVIVWYVADRVRLGNQAARLA